MREAAHEGFDTSPINVREEFIEAADSRPSSASNYLSKYETEFIINSSNTSSYSDRKLHKKVEKKVESLPLRIQRLVYDITVLEFGGYLDNAGQSWDHLPNLPGHAHLAARQLQGRSMDMDANNSELQLGYTIGLALSALTGTRSKSNRASDFLRGITLAYETDEHYMAQRNSAKTGKSRSDKWQVDDSKAKILKNFGIKPTWFLDRAIEVNNHAKANVYDECEVLSPAEAAEEYIESRLKEDYEQYRKVRCKLDEEWESISEAGTRGVKSSKVLRKLWELSYKQNSSEGEGRDKKTSTKIALCMGKREGHKNQVSHVLNRLSEDSKPSTQTDPTYLHNEIVKWTGQEWEFTDYGGLLAYHCIKMGQNPIWIQRIALGGTLPTEGDYRAPSEDAKQHLSDGIEELQSG